MIAVAGGSLGARRINDVVARLASEWAGRTGIAIRHVVGERDFDRVRAAAPEVGVGGLVYQQIRFENRMDLLLSAADVAVQRASASSHLGVDRGRRPLRSWYRCLARQGIIRRRTPTGWPMLVRQW